MTHFPGATGIVLASVLGGLVLAFRASPLPASEPFSAPAPASVTAGVEVLTVSDFSPQGGPFAWTTAPGATLAGASASGRVTGLAASPNGQRLYAASSNAGLWRSSDGGSSWCQLSSVIACPDGPASAIPVPVIAEVAVAPGSADGSVVLAAAAYDARVNTKAGIYRSIDAGGNWEIVHEFRCGGQLQPAYQVRFAPDDSFLTFAAGGCTIARSTDGGLTWTKEVTPSGNVADPIFHIAVGEYDPAVGHHWVYACGSAGFYFSTDNGDTWLKDTSGGNSGGGCGWGWGAHALAPEPGLPGNVYMVRYGGSNGPRFFDSGLTDGTFCNGTTVNCGEGSLWHAAFIPGNPAGSWFQAAGPPVYVKDPSTTNPGQLANSPSGVPFVLTRAKPGGGYLLFFGDELTIHVHSGRPGSSPNIYEGWHRLDGWDPWAYSNASGNRRGFFIHADAYDLAISQNFSVTLAAAPAGCDTPGGAQFCGNSALSSWAGRIWAANDGGVYFSDGAGAYQSWLAASAGLSTLSFNGAAVLARSGRNAAALYSGSQDNSTFNYNPDANWVDRAPNWTVAELDGDNAPYYADAARSDQVVHMDYERSRRFAIYRSYYGQYPIPLGDVAVQRTVISYPLNSTWANYLNRPVVQTLMNENVPALADLVRIGYVLLAGDVSVPRLYRTTNPVAPYGNWQPVGPILPDTLAIEGAGAVQTGGGHTNTTFYVKTSDGRLLRGPSVSGVMSSWTTVVSPTLANGACVVRSFFVDPYNPQRIYLDDPGNGGCAAGIKVSDDWGQTWQAATALQTALTNNGEFGLNCQTQKDGPACILNDLQFVRGEPQALYAAGVTGVFASSDRGVTWRRLLSNTDIPCGAGALGVDTVSTALTRSVYVFCYGRSVLRVSGVRGPSTTAYVSVSGGGSLSNEAGTIKAEFAARTVASDQTVIYAHQPAAHEALPEGRLGLEHFNLDAYDGLDQSVTQLTSTYTLTVSLDPAQLAFHSLAPEDVDLYHWSGSDWVPADACAGCKRVHNPLTIIKVIDHFSEFALLGTPHTSVLEAWPMFHRDAAHTGMVTASRARIRPPIGPLVRWKYQVTEPPEEARYGQYRWYSSFPLGDLDGDGKLEVVVTTPDNARACEACEPPRDRVIALRDTPGQDPPVRAMWIYTSPLTPTAWGFDQYSAALVDADGDGKPDVVFASKDGLIRALKGTDGSLLWQYDTGYFIEAGPMIADVDGNGSPDVVVPAGCTPTPSCANSLDVGSGALFVLAAHSTDGISGTLLYSLSVPYKIDSAEPAIADLDPADDTAIKHIVLGTWGGKLLVVWRTLDGAVVSQTLQLSTLVTDVITSTPAIRSSPLVADFGDGMTAVFGWMPEPANGADARLSAVRIQASTAAGTATFTPLWTRVADDWKSSPALLPLALGQPHLAVTGYGIGVGPNQGTGNYGGCDAVSGGILAMNVLSGSVAWSHDWGPGNEGNVRGSPGVADLDGDGVLDVVLPAGCYGKLHAYDGATGAEKWSRQLGPRTIGSPSLGDLDGDGALDIVVGSYDGSVWALSSPKRVYFPRAIR